MEIALIVFGIFAAFVGGFKANEKPDRFQKGDQAALEAYQKELGCDPIVVPRLTLQNVYDAGTRQAAQPKPVDKKAKP